MTLEARVSNFIAQRLYEKYQFKSVGTRKAYYSDNREDAVIMTANSIDSNEYRRSFEVLQDTYRARWGEIHIRL
jgi:ribosomal-protein-alanine N-acetyltransferase